MQFWPSLSFEYPELTPHAMQILLPFPTTYLCESSFSNLTAMKTKYRARLHVESDLRVCLSSITLRLDKLCSERQAHPSHWWWWWWWYYSSPKPVKSHLFTLHLPPPAPTHTHPTTKKWLITFLIVMHVFPAVCLTLTPVWCLLLHHWFSLY